MEASPAFNGTESHGRGWGDKIRKGLFLKGKGVLPGMGAALAVLLMMKIILSFFYLQSNRIGISPVNLALAENKKTVKPADEGEKPEGSLSREKMKELERALKEKEKDLEKREAALAPLKKEIEGKLAELNELQTRLTAYAKKLAEREKALNDSKNGHLVALYSAMEPARAAAIMDKLKLPTVVLILRNMKGKTAGQIMAMMSPDRGALISEKMNQID